MSTYESWIVYLTLGINDRVYLMGARKPGRKTLSGSSIPERVQQAFGTTTDWSYPNAGVTSVTRAEWEAIDEGCRINPQTKRVVTALKRA